jgi:hypothetical protein
VTLPPEATTVVGLKIVAPHEAKPGTTFTTHLVHLNATGRRLVGGVAVQVRVGEDEQTSA